MPLLNDFSDGGEWAEPDNVPRPFVAYGIEALQVGPIELDVHRHHKGQIMLVQRGALSCEVEGALWIVPPGSAIWIPSNALHGIKSSGLVAGYDAFIDPTACAHLPSKCCAVLVTALLRELLARAATLPLLYEESAANARLLGVLIDELTAAPVDHLHLPMPADPRLRKIVNEMMASPAYRGTLNDWAARSGLSERTLERLIARETGLSFGRWRRHLGVFLAVKWLAGGASIKEVAANLGYESVPSFMTMFRKSLGTSPRRYMAERHLRRH